MKNHEDGYDNGHNNRNEDEHDNNNLASGSGSDGQSFDLIATTWSRLGLVEEDQGTMTTALWLRRYMYLCAGIYLPYKYPINSLVNMCHKLLYAKIGVF